MPETENISLTERLDRAGFSTDPAKLLHQAHELKQEVERLERMLEKAILDWLASATVVELKSAESTLARIRELPNKMKEAPIACANCMDRGRKDSAAELEALLGEDK